MVVKIQFIIRTTMSNKTNKRNLSRQSVVGEGSGDNNDDDWLLAARVMGRWHDSWDVGLRVEGQRLGSAAGLKE